MDRTSDYAAECSRCWRQLGALGEPGFWAPSGSLLPQLADRSEFTRAAFALHAHIREAKAFVKENHRDFVERGRCRLTYPCMRRSTARSSQMDTDTRSAASNFANAWSRRRQCVRWGMCITNARLQADCA